MKNVEELKKSREYRIRQTYIKLILKVFVCECLLSSCDTQLSGRINKETKVKNKSPKLLNWQGKADMLVHVSGGEC